LLQRRLRHDLDYQLTHVAIVLLEAAPQLIQLVGAERQHRLAHIMMEDASHEGLVRFVAFRDKSSERTRTVERLRLAGARHEGPAGVDWLAIVHEAKPAYRVEGLEREAEG